MSKIFELSYLPPALDRDGSPRSLILQIFRRCIGIVFAGLGACIIVVMTIAASHEVRGEGDFYALAISCLVVVFGVLLTRDGVYLASGYRLHTSSEGDVRAPEDR